MSAGFLNMIVPCARDRVPCAQSLLTQFYNRAREGLAQLAASALVDVCGV